jgi:hypothetical protein
VSGEQPLKTAAYIVRHATQRTEARTTGAPTAAPLVEVEAARLRARVTPGPGPGRRPHRPQGPTTHHPHHAACCGMLAVKSVKLSSQQSAPQLFLARARTHTKSKNNILIFIFAISISISMDILFSSQQAFAEQQSACGASAVSSQVYYGVMRCDACHVHACACTVGCAGRLWHNIICHLQSAIFICTCICSLLALAHSAYSLSASEV